MARCDQATLGELHTNSRGTNVGDKHRARQEDPRHTPCRPVQHGEAEEIGKNITGRIHQPPLIFCHTAPNLQHGPCPIRCHSTGHAALLAPNTPLHTILPWSHQEKHISPGPPAENDRRPDPKRTNPTMMKRETVGGEQRSILTAQPHPPGHLYQPYSVYFFLYNLQYKQFI